MCPLFLRPVPDIDSFSRLFLASEAYYKALSKRKANEGLDDAEKLLPVETLGIVMIIHGEEFAHESPFGTWVIFTSIQTS